MLQLADLKSSVERRVSEYQTACSSVQTERECLTNSIEKEQNLKEALGIVQTVAKDVQDQVHQKIADVVTRSLQSVFGDEAYTFKIRFDQKRGKTEAVLIFERDGEEIDPMTASGGGVLSVASFALRLSCLMLSKPPLRRVLILDEPFAALSVDYRERVRDLLIQLSKELQVQMIIVSHLSELEVGKVVRL